MTYSTHLVNENVPRSGKFCLLAVSTELSYG